MRCMGYHWKCRWCFCRPSSFCSTGSYRKWGVWGEASWWTILLLIGSGALTVIPLIFYANAAQQIPLSTMGLLFYITPTMQFLIGVLVFGEPFTQARMIDFGLV